MRLRRTLTASGSTAALLLAVGCAGNDTGAPEQAEQLQTGEGTKKQVTMAEVQQNDSTDSCWTVIENIVYDITAWVDQHPGGPDRIEQLCGTDGTESFTDQHSGASQPQSRLAEFQIGQLAG